jgi:hypothetical protein
VIHRILGKFNGLVVLLHGEEQPGARLKEQEGQADHSSHTQR